MTPTETLINKLNDRLANLGAKSRQLQIDIRVTEAEIHRVREIRDELVDITKS